MRYAIGVSYLLLSLIAITIIPKWKGEAPPVPQSVAVDVSPLAHRGSRSCAPREVPVPRPSQVSRPSSPDPLSAAASAKEDRPPVSPKPSRRRMVRSLWASKRMNKTDLTKNTQNPPIQVKALSRNESLA